MFDAKGKRSTKKTNGGLMVMNPMLQSVKITNKNTIHVDRDLLGFSRI